MQQPDATHVSTGRIPREQIYSRISSLKRVIVVGTIAAFGALWALAGTHTAGVTAQRAQHQQQPGQPAQDPGSFFNNAGNSNIGPSDNGGVASSGPS